ncbi:cbb3-type cytochrome oxidase assembly protein CcoS [Psychrobacter piechaudii]|uniref:Cytochrome oxidase maturation protein cbb3-type n=1 Tax=Psychrobacter piechaudii TaxID=1945521 RepID=A0A1R4GY64_9GAMM|nr:cbb3-type cytochrome oxidase assembly protein CcoS [Psychrobacter piechaudii]SJM72752.1 Cytochrome oxidase maturation protein cbb3-type [Psychrobacter piechaudii]
MVSMYLLIPLSLMLFVIGIWAVRYAVRSNQFEDLDNESQRVILDDRQERRQALGGNPNPTTPKADTPPPKVNNQSNTSNISQADSKDESADGK